MKARWFVVPPVCLAAGVAVALLVSFSSQHENSILAQRNNLLAIAGQYPRFTQTQRMAILRERESEKHPRWRDMSVAEMARHVLRLATTPSASAQAPLASFFGNLTAITSPNGTVGGMVRETNCTLTMGWVSYTLSLPSANYSVPTPTLNYDQVLHSESGLKTTGGTWPSGCGDATLGIPSRSVVPLGISPGKLVAAAAGYDPMTGNQVIWTFSGSLSGTNSVSIGAINLSGSAPIAVVAADLNGDGITDLVSINEAATTGASASVSVLLGNADGSFQSPVNYMLPGTQGLSAVIDDFNGDGKLDIVATSSSITTVPATYSLSFLEGEGNGTFAAPQSVTVAAPSSYNIYTGTNPYFGIISADLRGNGTKDLVTSGGIVLLGNGNGTFTQSNTLAFPTPLATSQWGPDVIAADFNKDGKLDLAVGNGESIATYLGNGDGTFTAGNAYAAIDNTGVLAQADLDGDGNVDLYSGTARGGYFGGDQFEANESYALMGNGNGTFRGAPEMPFVFTGTNVMDLNGDGIPDGVGVNETINDTNISMTTYLGKSDGSFTADQTFTISPVTINGTSYAFSSVDSFGLGDINGDGKPDLVYMAGTFNGPVAPAGFMVATGEGNGSFNTPVFVAAPAFLPSGAPTGDFDDTETLSNLFVADMNGDGKADLVYNYSAVDYNLNTYVQGVAVQLSNGDGTFQAPKVVQTYSSTTIPPSLQPALTQVAATRASGVRDLFVLLQSVSNGTVTTKLELFLGNGDGTFGAATTPPVADNINQPFTGAIQGQIVLADMNGDGKPDLITLGTSNTGNVPELAISLGNGDGTFQAPAIVDFGSGSSAGFGLAAADFNGDGKVDVAVTGYNPPVDTGIFLGNGDGTVQTFSPASGLVEPAEGIDLILAGTAMTADFNGDGKPDLVAGSAVLLNLGAPATLIPTTTALTASSTTITAGTNVTLTATVSASSTPSGNVTFYDGTTALATTGLNSSGVATYSTSALSVGTHTVTASFAAGSTFAGSTSSAVTITVTSLPLSTSTLTASATTITVGASVTLTDTVASASGSGPTPTGMVTFLNGSTQLGTGTVTGGTATYQTTALPTGSDSITAVYGGDANYAGSNSNALTITVNSVTPSFTIAASPTSATVTAGGSTQSTITVTPAGGFNSLVNFACTGQPTGGTCSFSPSTVTPNGTSSTTTTLNITTAAGSGALTMPWRPGSRTGGVALAFLAGGVVWFFGRRRRALWSRMLPVVIVLAISAFVMACGGSNGSGGGGGGGKQAQNYTITITASSGSESQTTTFTLTVD